MSATKTTLELAIKNALIEVRTGEVSTTADADAKLNKIAADLSAAIDVYVVAKLTALGSQLKLPSAFIGTGATGPVTIAPASFAGYDPTRT